MQCAIFLVLLSFANSGHAATRLKIQGSTTVNPIVSDAAEPFRERGWKIFVDTQGGSSGGISALGEGLVDIGMTSRPITATDTQKFPKANFVSHSIGFDGVALIVSQPVYDGGTKQLTKSQIKNIYEGKIKRWKEVGGPDTPIVFFNKEPGRGTWEVFANFLYGKANKAPSVFHAEVGANEETRTKVGHHKSAISQLSATWADGQEKVQALAIENEGGKFFAPSLQNVRDGSYPLRRELFVVTRGEPSGAVKEFIQYLRGPKGQALVEKHGYLPLSNIH